MKYIILLASCLMLCAITSRAADETYKFGKCRITIVSEYDTIIKIYASHIKREACYAIAYRDGMEHRAKSIKTTFYLDR